VKHTLLTAFRAMLFAICILLLATVGGFKVKTGVGVAAFVLIVAALWMVVEKVLIAAFAKKKAPARTR
jgi:hypothetical protein